MAEEDDDTCVYVYDRRQGAEPPCKINLGGVFYFSTFCDNVKKVGRLCLFCFDLHNYLNIVCMYVRYAGSKFINLHAFNNLDTCIAVWVPT